MARLILVVDDELAGLRRVHVEGTVADFYDAVADPNDLARTWSRAEND